MSQTLLAPLLPELSDADWLAQLRAIVERDLAPMITQVDAQGVYPREFMRNFGAAGGFGQSAPLELGGGGRGVAATIAAMEIISETCLSTGFCAWCQSVCGWYIQHGQSQKLKDEVLPGVLDGSRGAGTGLSNPMKHFAGIENLNVKATRTPGGYLINGALPWISNVDVSHCFAVVARVEDEGNYLMAIVDGDAPGLRLGGGGEFIALEGSSTYACRFSDVFVSNDAVLAHPCDSYIKRVRPGFVLTQCGFGLGLTQSCVALMKKANRRTAHVNCFLDDTVEDIESDLMELRARVYALAGEVESNRPNLFRDVVQARYDASDLSLRASKGAMLYAGAAGYRLGGVTERKLRESYFVAVVTPAMKHLKKLLHDLPETA